MLRIAFTRYRITPAYAGKSEDLGAGDIASEDHPRLRGEKAKSRFAQSGSPGSPPLTRGKVFAFVTTDEPARITPAYAGKSCRRSFPICIVEDHPRLRGEKLRVRACDRSAAGSPPLTRGKDSSTLCRCRRQRITPAYAGKSWQARHITLPYRDHPRLRGEKVDSR